MMVGKTRTIVSVEKRRKKGRLVASPVEKVTTRGNTKTASSPGISCKSESKTMPAENWGARTREKCRKGVSPCHINRRRTTHIRVRTRVDNKRNSDNQGDDRLIRQPSGPVGSPPWPTVQLGGNGGGFGCKGKDDSYLD